MYLTQHVLKIFVCITDIKVYSHFLHYDSEMGFMRSTEKHFTPRSDEIFNVISAFIRLFPPVAADVVLAESLLTF